MTAPLAIWLTHNQRDDYARQVAGHQLAIIPDRAFHFPGPWIAAVRAAVPQLYVYTRSGHGPAFADTNASQPAEWIEAQAIEAWGAHTSNLASAQGARPMYWYNMQLVAPLSMGAVKLEVLRPAWPYIDGVMWDFLDTRFEFWQRQVINAHAEIRSNNGFGFRATITNGRPGLAGYGRFLESMGRLDGWWDTMPQALDEIRLPDGVPLILDLYRKPELRELAETIAMLRPNTYICEGRMRATGLVTA